MTEHARWSELFEGSWVITGNTAKVQVLHDLYSLLEQNEKLAILDVGCVGPEPLDFWTPLMQAYEFKLTGIDVTGLDRARAVIQERGWDERVRLKKGTGYELESLFPEGSFDVVIATQVLEHVARLELFLGQVSRIVRPGGRVFFTLDSAHWTPRYPKKNPYRLMKNIVKKLLALIGRERHYDLPWTAREIVVAAERAGFAELSTRYYNLHPLKQLHNHVVYPSRKNEFMAHWFELERTLNERDSIENARHLFQGIYVRGTKPA